MAEPTADELYELAAAPQSMAVDGQSVSERSADDIIQLNNYAANRAALAGTNANGGPKSAWGQVRMGKACPPGGSGQ